MNDIPLQLMLGNNERVYCSKCKVNLADLLVEAKSLEKKPYCNKCKPEGRYLW